MKPNLTKNLLTVFSILTILTIISCSKKIHPQKEEAIKTTPAKPGYEEAMVRYFKRDGCDYALQLNSGENLEPDKLPLKFQKDSLKVWVKYKERTDAASICMIGKMVKVIDIKKK
jgi:hypothetical protein